jgi:hypothetical protein
MHKEMFVVRLGTPGVRLNRFFIGMKNNISKLENNSQQ